MTCRTEGLCVMRQPLTFDGRDSGGPLLESCLDPVTHTDQAGVNQMCTAHARYHRRYIGPTRRVQ